MNWYLGFEAFVSERASLAPMTTYRVGGPAQYFALPPDAEALGALLRRAREHEIPVRLLGHGTNLLVSDEGGWITGQNYPVNGGFTLAL